MPDAHKNFAYSTVATAPSPASSGTSLVVAAGHGTRFPTPPFNATVWPANTQPLPTNSEIVRVTAIGTDTLTVVRNTPTEPNNQVRSIVVGDQIMAGITAKTILDTEGTAIGVYNVRNIGGALANGTDDKAAIQTTVDACHTGGGGIVFFPPGLYKTASQVLVAYGSTQIRGSGQQTTTLYTAHDATFIPIHFSGSGYTGGTIGTYQQEGGVRDLRIDQEWGGGVIPGFTSDPTNDYFYLASLGDNGLANGSYVVFSGLSGTTGISNGVAYYVVNRNALTIQVALTPGGSAINITGSNQTGNITITATVGVTNTGSTYAGIKVEGWVRFSAQDVSVWTFNPGIEFTSTVDTMLERCTVSNSFCLSTTCYGYKINGTPGQNASFYMSNSVSGQGAFAGTTSYGIWVSGDHIADVYMHFTEADGWSWGYWFDGTDADAFSDVFDTHLISCVADQCTVGGFKFKNIVADAGQYNVESCYAASASNNHIGLDVDTSNGIDVRGFHCWANTGSSTYGIYVHGSKDISIIGANLKGNLARHIYIASSTYISCIGNIITGTLSGTTTGIYCSAVTKSTFVANTIRAVGSGVTLTNGFYLDATSNVKLGFNIIDTTNVTNPLAYAAGATWAALGNDGIADTGIVLPDTMAADQTGSGFTSVRTAGETLAFGDPVYFKSDGKVWKADADGSSTFPVKGLALGAATANNPVTILERGTIRNDAWSWTIAGPIYLSTSAGLTQTKPSTTDNVIQELGVAFPNADTIAFNPSPDYATRV